jgi:hypothetical protein
MEGDRTIFSWYRTSYSRLPRALQQRGTYHEGWCLLLGSASYSFRDSSASTTTRVEPIPREKEAKKDVANAENLPMSRDLLWTRGREPTKGTDTGWIESFANRAEAGPGEPGAPWR